MQAILNALGEQHSELAALLDQLDDDDWGQPTRGDGWTVADVVLHLAQTDELALASAEGRFTNGLEVLAGSLTPERTVDGGAAAMVARERGSPLRHCSNGGGPAPPRCATRSGPATRTVVSVGSPVSCRPRC